MKPEEAKTGMRVITKRGRRGILGKIYGDGSAGARVKYPNGSESVLWVRDLKPDTYDSIDTSERAAVPEQATERRV